MKLKPGVMLVISIMTISILLCGRSKTFAQSPSHPESFKLWPSGAPGAVGNEPVDAPTLTPYLPKENATGAAVIVCPGGGYTHLADHEGRPVAEWLNSIGIAAFVLKYRLGPRYHHPAPLQDAPVQFVLFPRARLSGRLIPSGSAYLVFRPVVMSLRRLARTSILARLVLRTQLKGSVPDRT